MSKCDFGLDFFHKVHRVLDVNATVELEDLNSIDSFAYKYKGALPQSQHPTTKLEHTILGKSQGIAYMMNILSPIILALIGLLTVSAGARPLKPDVPVETSYLAKSLAKQAVTNAIARNAAAEAAGGPSSAKVQASNSYLAKAMAQQAVDKAIAKNAGAELFAAKSNGASLASPKQPSAAHVTKKNSAFLKKAAVGGAVAASFGGAMYAGSALADHKFRYDNMKDRDFQYTLYRTGNPNLWVQ